MTNKKIFLIMAILLLTVFAQAQDDTLKVLFLGNSHTFYNNLPQMFVELSQSGERPVITDFNTPGGHTLEQHSANLTSLEKISQGIWDYVILQEHSLYPTIDYFRYNSMYPAARLLDSIITEHNASTTFFMTWGWRYGGQFNIDGHSSPEFRDFFHMQDTVNSAYTQIADELSAVLSPVGNAWATAVTWDSTINLWQNDNYHPLLEGSYLAACVFYATLFDSSPVGLTYTAGLSIEVATFLQEAAYETITDITEEPANIPLSFELYQNYPNPFNSKTVIRYSLQNDTKVVLKIYDILGREVKTLVNTYQDTGLKSAVWDGKDSNGERVNSGVYFYRIQADGRADCKKLIFLK